MTKIQIFAAGALGAAGPNLLRMAREALQTAAPADPSYLNLGFWVGLAVFAIVGGAIASWKKPADFMTALAVGATAPALVLGANNGAGSTTSEAHSTTIAARTGWLVTPLLAESRDVVQGRWRWVRVTGLSDAGSAGADLVAVLGVPATTSITDTVPEQVRFHMQGNEAVVRVPAQTRQVLVAVGGARTAPLTITSLPGDTVTVQLTVGDRSFASGFRRALGLRDFATAEPALTRRP